MYGWVETGKVYYKGVLLLIKPYCTFTTVNTLPLWVSDELFRFQSRTVHT